MVGTERLRYRGGGATSDLRTDSLQLAKDQRLSLNPALVWIDPWALEQLFDEFDASLRARNANMGIRDLDDLEILAGQNGLELARVYAMPTNNLLVVWAKKER